MKIKDYIKDFISVYKISGEKVEQDKTNILCFIHEYKRTGAPLCLLDTCKVLTKQNYNVFLVGPEKSDLAYEFSNLNVNVIEINLINHLYFFSDKLFLRIIYLPIRIFINLYLQFLFFWIFLKIKPEIIFLNSFASRFAAIASGIYPAKIIWHILEDYNQKKIYPKIFKYFVNISSNVIIACSQNSKNIWSAGKGKKIQLIYIPIDFPETYEDNVTDKEFDIVFIGRITPEKGIRVLLQALFETEKKYDKGYNAAIIGRFSEPEFEIEVKNFIKNSLEKSKVSLLINYPNPFEILLKSKCFVLPTLDDNFPRVIGEAMLCKLPVIASKVGGIPEVVKDCENGFLIETGNASMFSEKIHYLMSNPELCSALGHNAYETAQKIFKFEIYGNELQKTIKQLLK